MVDWIFKIVCWLSSVYFFYAFSNIAGFPPKDQLTNTTWFYLVFSIFFFLLPFSKHIKLAKIIDFERDIKKIQDDMKEFKEEIRNNLSIISASINTISNLSNIVNVHVTNPEEKKAAEEGVSEVASESISAEAEKIMEELVLDDEDIIMPLARTRISIEQLLRKILGKRRIIDSISEKDVRFYSIRTLFKEFLRLYPKFKNLEHSLNYVLKVCNAAIHGQRIAEEEAKEALLLGAKIIAILKEIAELSQDNPNGVQ